MANIRPKDLPAAPSVTNAVALVIDTGADVQKATPLQIMDAGRPLASQVEAEAGTDNAKIMSPLRVAQAVTAGLVAPLGGKENSITTGSNTQYWRGDKTWQTLNKASVGLSNVDNIASSVLLARANHTGTQSADTLTDGTTNKAFLAAERSKLTAIAAGATANDTDANLKNRANHTGSQAISTVAGLQTILDRTVNPLNATYAAVGDGVADDRSALAAADAVAFAAGKPLIITARHRIASNITLQSDLLFLGGKLEPATGVTVTGYGTITAGWSQIFAGAGSVVGFALARPEWFGAVGDGVANDTPALQKAHDCVEAAYGNTRQGTRSTLELGRKIYGLGTTFKMRPTAYNCLRVVGAGPLIGGSRFQVLSSFATTNGVMAIHIEGTAAALPAPSTNFDIGGFAILPYTGGVSACTDMLQIGSLAATLQGVQQNLLHDVHISDGFTRYGLRLINVRLIDFDRCSIWERNVTGSLGLKFDHDTAASFTGDVNFNTCQFVGGTANKLVDISPTVSAAQSKGIRFNSCMFYGKLNSVTMSPTGGGIVGDIHFTGGCQFDGFQGNVFTIKPSGSGSTVDDIRIRDCYIRGINTGVNAIDAQALSSATLASIWITGNWFANIADGARAVLIQDCRNVHIDDNEFTECNSTTAEMILLGQNVRSFTVTGNTLIQVTAIVVTWLISVGTGCDYGFVCNNTGNGSVTNGPGNGIVRNLSAGTHLTLVPNW